MKPFVTLAIVVLLAISAARVESQCTDANIRGVSINSPTTAFPQTDPVTLPSIEIRTVGSYGEFIPTGVETITVQAPSPGSWQSALDCTGTASGTCQLTTTAGKVTFTGLKLTGPPAIGTFFLEFKVCGTLYTDKLETIITAGTAAKIDWNRQPEPTIASYGYVHLQPRLAYYDSAGAISDVVNVGDQFELETDDAQVVIQSATVTPTATSGNIIEFSSTYYQMLCTPNCAGRTFKLRLKRIGSITSATPPPIPFPPELTITVAACNHDFRITPAITGVSFDNFVVPGNNAGAVDVGLRGWHFPSSVGTTGKCRYDGVQYSMNYIDMCNVACQLPGTPNSGKTLEISLNGVVFETLGTLALHDDDATQYTLQPTVSSVNLHKENYVITAITFHVVDKFGTKLLANAPTQTVSCTTTDFFADNKRISSPYSSPRTGQTETPVNTPTLVKGSATVDFVFYPYIEADIYTFVCSVTTMTQITTNVTLNVYEDCPTPPSISSVSTTGCTVSGSNLENCKTAGSTVVTVNGKDFGRSGARIRIGSWWCDTTTHDALQPATILYGTGCKGRGTGHNVLVFTPQMVYGMYSAGTYNFANSPTITSIAGCQYDFYPSTANCDSIGNSTVTITGTNFGTSGAKVYFYYQVPIGATTRIQATTVTHNGDGSLTATGFPGTGQRFDVAVENSNGELTREKYVTMSYVASVIIDCPVSGGIQCGGNGDCNTFIGVCTCSSDSVTGYWTGSACDSCQAGYFGATCTGECPGGAATPCTNAGRGTCSEGVSGTGICTCASGYGGTACQSACPGGVSSPCSGRGTCNQGIDPPTCTCHADAVNGFWNPSTDCLTCADQYVGANCHQKCPFDFTTPLLKCNGKGTCASSSSGAVCINCDTGYCGAACATTGVGCGVCDAGPAEWGAGCANWCPGSPSHPTLPGTAKCNGHGSCSDGVSGTGQCVCNDGYAGAACQTACPGLGGASGPCSGHGTCDALAGTCTCEPGYGTSDCSVSCPGFPTNTCSNNGICNSGSTSNADCTCNLGYSGSQCDTECPGGVASPCSYHGTCNQDSTCTCYSTQLLGYWTVASNCSKCETGWWGANCNGTCPINNGAQCALHGECTDAVLCRCHASSSQGYWAEPNCTDCKENYFGANCTKACPGGACNACSGNGICSDGILGTGVCSCFSNTTAGFWMGSKCSECQPSKYGSTCTAECPFSGGLVCAGHGVCYDGVTGNGTCKCQYDAVNGFWGGSACPDCDSAHYGASCQSTCTGMTAGGLPCSGHGTCNSGIIGDGSCTCQTGWGSIDCSVGCDETKPGEYCSGHGTCLDGSSNPGGCQCYNDTNQGFWSTSNCGDCDNSHYGTSCIQQCPFDATPLLCAGHGFCNSGVNGSGSCQCDQGYAMADCSATCPGGVDKPCSDHGTCSSVDATCTCFSDPTNGYWTNNPNNGQTCDICLNSHNGSEASGCLTPCPIGLGTYCSGHGICQDGVCVQCDSGYCHDKNDVVKSCSSTSCVPSCPQGFWGVGCDQECPGGKTCSGHGFCDRDLESPFLGTCKCFSGSGYFGTDCAAQCPGGGTCNYHGICNQTSGLCSCDDGWRLANCSLECPGGADNQCNLHGACQPDGTCDCNPGYATADCSVECPPGINSTAGICSNHGVCNATDATCGCYGDSTNGYWTGTACDSCQPGYFGSNCLNLCVNGVTSGTTCVCNQYYSGPACDVVCPGMVDYNNGTLDACAGHGTCTWGETLEKGNCTCDTNYFTEDCTIFCSPDKCKQQPHYLVNGECDINTGTCTCIDNTVQGHWADTSTFCQTCTMLYYGPSCLQECQCGGHGTCDKDSGACQCFDDDARGHYDGTSCDKCKEGFIGDTCKGKDVTVTRQRPCSAITSINDTSAFILMDPTYDVIMTGARPIIICNLTTKTQISILDINASVVSGRFGMSDDIVLTINRIDGEPQWQTQKQVRCGRGRRPSLSFLEEGSAFTPNTLAVGNQSNTAQRSMQVQEVHAYTEPILVETIVHTFGSGTSAVTKVITVFSNGMVQMTDGTLSSPSEFYFNGHFVQIQTAAVTNTALISPARLILGGSIAGQWKIITVDFTTTGDLTASSNSSVVDITPTVTANSAFCSGSETCQSAAKIVTSGVWLYVATIRQKGVGINKFRLTLLDSPAFRVEYNAIVATTLTVAPYPTYNVTAMILDEPSGAGFVAINSIVDTVQEASIIHKFDLLSLQVYGSARFQKVVDDYEIVKAFTKNDDTRTLYATVPLNEQLNIVPLNLFAVTKVYPAIADTVGGTVITIEGEGFINDDNFLCDFNGTFVKADFISSREAHCTAPVGGDERCEGTPLEVTIASSTQDQLTKNNVRLRRVSSPQITSVYTERFAINKTDNSYGNLTGGELVILEGSGFQDSPYLACRFKSDNYDDAQYAYLSDRDYSYSGGAQGVKYNSARFINATRIECDQPAFPSPTRGTSRVEVTLDGNVWSRTGKEYQVVGEANGVATYRMINGQWSRNFRDSYDSLDTVEIQPFIVWVVDSEFQRLRDLDTESHQMVINFTKFESSSGNVSNLGANDTWTQICEYPRNNTNAVPIAYNNNTQGRENNTLSGYTWFQGWSFQRPPAGIYTFTISSVQRATDNSGAILSSPLWSFDHTFTVNVGKPYILKICTEPPLTLDNLSPTLKVHPKLYVEDISGNQLPSSALSKTRVVANYTSEETITESLTDNQRDVLGVPVNFSGIIPKNELRVAQLEGNFLKFDQLEMKGLHGSTYRITFTGTGETDQDQLIPAYSREIAVEPCHNNANTPGALMYFAKIGTSECFVCPEGGICDGSFSITLARDNLWRPDNTSYKFYSCEAPISGDSCLAAWNNLTNSSGSCKAGYTGPRCSVCVDGYGKDGDFCIACRSPGAIVGFMILVVVITLIFVILLIYASFTTPTRETLPIIMKIAINHLQIASRVNEIVAMPQALVDLFTVSLSLSELIRFDIISAECPPLKLNVYGRFYLAVSVPFLVLVFFAMTYFVLFIYRRVKDIGPKYPPVEPTKAVKRDRVMVVVTKFMAKLKGAAYQYHGDVSRDDLTPQFYTSTQYFVATTVIVLALVYPTVLQWCASMWKCDDIVYGDADTLRTVSYLAIDRSVVCTDDSHKVVQAIALAAALTYGAGVPLLCVLVVYRHWNQHGRVHTRRLYAYITAGFDISTWWWESVVMARKAVIVFIIIFVGDEILRTYLSMWTMTLALGVHGWFQPYDPKRPSLYYLEGLGITTLVVTLNLSLLFQFDDIFGTNSAPFWILVIFLFMINVFVILVYFIFICIQMFKRVKALVTGKKDDLVDPKADEAKYNKGDAADKDEFTSFRNMDRHDLQRDGLVGALRSAAKLKPQYAEERKVTASSLPAKAGETPFERVQRLEAERRKEALRVEQVNIQADLEAELEELRDRMVRAQALAAAEEAIVSKNKEMAAARQRHEDELLRLMDEIRKERGEFVAKADNQKEFQKDLMQSIQFEMGDDEDDDGNQEVGGGFGDGKE